MSNTTLKALMVVLLAAVLTMLAALLAGCKAPDYGPPVNHYEQLYFHYTSTNLTK